MGATAAWPGRVRLIRLYGRLSSHDRTIGFDAGDDLGLVLAGGYAISQYGLTSRSSRDVDFATASRLPLAEVTVRLAQAYQAAGYTVTVVESTSRMARIDVTDGTRACEVDLLKEAIGPPTRLAVGPVLAIDDAVGLKMRALYSRTMPRDIIDVRAAGAAGYSTLDLERLGRQHTPEFRDEELADRLAAVADLPERGFTAYGLTEDIIADLRAWALAWESDLRTRLAGEPDQRPGTAEPDWDAYLDE